MVLAFILLTGSLLAACSGSNETESSGEDAVQKESGTPVELTMWAHQGQEKEVEFYKQRVKEFNENYKGKIKVNLEIIPSGQGHTYEDKINAAVSSNDAPDVMDMDGPFVANYAATGILQPLDAYISEEFKNGFVDSIIQQGTYDGKLYALGAMESSVALFYNKKIFEEEGIEVPTSLEEAWTWDEFYQVAKQLTTEDRYGVDLNMDEGVGEWLTYMGSVFVWSNGGRLIAEDGSAAEGYVNGPETVEALEFVRKLFNEKVVNIAPGPTDFEEGRAAMSLNGPWMIQGFDKYPELEWGLIPFPYSKEQKSPSGSWAWGVSAQSEHPEEAAEVVKWMTNTEAAVQLSSVTGMPPSRKDAFKELPHYDELPLKIIKEQVTNTAQARPTTPAYPVLTAKFAEAFHAAALNQDPKQALDQVANLVDRELERFNK